MPVYISPFCQRRHPAQQLRSTYSHTVRNTEKPARNLWKSWELASIARIFRAKRTGRKCRSQLGRRVLARFSPKANAAVWFRPLIRANLLRSQSDHEAKA